MPYYHDRRIAASDNKGVIRSFATMVKLAEKLSEDEALPKMKPPQKARKMP